MNSLVNMRPLPLLLLVSLGVAGQALGGNSAEYDKIVEAGKKEGRLVIYSTTDSKAAAPLVKDFSALYPAIKVEYNDMNSTEVYSRFIAEAAAGGNTADVLWSSAMDLQMRLASDGYALQYKSVEAQNVPGWAAWNDMAYGTTFEPAAIVYNKRLVDAREVPQTHADFAKLISSDKFRDKVTTYDIEKSGVGFMFMTQDARELGIKFPELEKAFGVARVRVQSSTGTMLERISSGENLIGYNVLGSYALVRAKADPSLGVVLPKDYTLILSRVQFINKGAKNVNAAKLWVDYILSHRGQTVIANDAKLFAIRSDVSGETTSADLIKQIGKEYIKPVPVHPIVLQFLGPAKRTAFLNQWKETAGKK